jgi:hypothetical protein
MPDANATPSPEGLPEALAAVRLLLARGQPRQAMAVGMAAARLAGEGVLDDRPDLPAGERLALALPAADEVLEALAVELAGGDPAGGKDRGGRRKK